MKEKKGLFLGQLTLLTAMLVSLPKSGLVNEEALRFLRAKCVTGIDLIRKFPTDMDIVEAYVSVLELVGGGNGWATTVGKVGGKIDKGALGLSLHVCNFPLRVGLGVSGTTGVLTAMVNGGRKRGAPGGERKCWWDGIDVDNLSPPERGRPTDGLRSVTGEAVLTCVAEYELANRALRVAIAGLGFSRARAQDLMEAGLGEVLELDAVLLGGGIETCADLSRIADNWLRETYRENRFNETTLDEIACGDLRVRVDDVVMQGIYEEAQLVLDLGRNCALVVENLLSLASEHLQNLAYVESNTNSKLARRAISALVDTMLVALDRADLENSGLGCLQVSAGSGGDGHTFARRIGLVLREKCEIMKEGLRGVDLT